MLSIMTRIHKITSLILLAGVLVTSCRPENFKEIGTQSSVVSSLAGTWKLTRVTQTDEDAKSKGFNYGPVNIQQMDLTNVFPYTDFKLTLNATGNTPTTFTAVPGNYWIIQAIPKKLPWQMQLIRQKSHWEVILRERRQF
ncbi:MAG: DUF5004 domain-containing protein [Chitinophagaceae bacterium]|nr:MAG: DUF5004 domain-containing protein [Chitinophagaceae bacterium]